jgi:purine-cytosine permease-like protein
MFQNILFSLNYKLNECVDFLLSIYLILNFGKGIMILILGNVLIFFIPNKIKLCI